MRKENEFSKCRTSLSIYLASLCVHWKAVHKLNYFAETEQISLLNTWATWVHHFCWRKLLIHSTPSGIIAAIRKAKGFVSVCIQRKWSSNIWKSCCTESWQPRSPICSRKFSSKHEQGPCVCQQRAVSTGSCSAHQLWPLHLSTKPSNMELTCKTPTKKKKTMEFVYPSYFCSW